MLSFIFFSSYSLALDGKNSVTNFSKEGDWLVTEFAMKTQILYRVSSTAINANQSNIVFDYVPSKNCKPDPAVLINEHKKYIPDLDHGMAALAYKITGQSESMEITKTVMQKNDRFAFFQFQKLTVDSLLSSNDEGKLAIWVPASFDGTVKRSSNIYFSLDGLSKANQMAVILCKKNS